MINNIFLIKVSKHTLYKKSMAYIVASGVWALIYR